MNGPPEVGKTVSSRVDAGLHADLTVLMQTGRTASEALRHAVNIVAGAYRAAWSRGHYPPGAEPVIDSADLAPYTPGQPPAGAGQQP